MIKNPPVIKRVIREMGGTIEDFIPERGCFYANISGKRILFARKVEITRQPFVSRELEKSKDITYNLLRENKLPTAETRCFYKRSLDKKEALSSLESLVYPIAIKHSSGSNGKGVYLYVKSPERAYEMLIEKLPQYKYMIAQEMVHGREYRVLVLGEKVIGVIEMYAPYLIGDGVSSIAELCQERVSSTVQEVEINSDLESRLQEQDVNLKTILPKNERVNIKDRTADFFGWQLSTIDKDIHPGVEEICVAASKAVGKYLVGIDVICDNIAKDPKENAFSIIEINGKPDLYIHYDPDYGKSQNVIEHIVKYLLSIA